MVQLRQLLREKPLIAMGFRLRRSARLGPLRFNFSSGGLSSISVGRHPRQPLAARAQCGCNGIRRLHGWKTPLSSHEERADDPAPAPTLSTDL